MAVRDLPKVETRVRFSYPAHMQKYSDIIQKAIKEDFEFQKSLEIVKKNSNGKIWIMGSFVFRNIASAIHNLPKPVFKDYDFVVEELNKNVNIDNNLNTFGGLKIKNKEVSIDIWELRKTYLITRLNLEPTIENCLKTASLSIQSIAFNLEENKILGSVGLRSILEKNISVNNMQNFKYYTERKGLSLEEYLKNQIKKWGFEDFIINWDSLKN